MKLLIASLLLLFCPRKGFEWFVKKCIPDEYNNSNFSNASCLLRKKIHSAAIANFVFFSIVIAGVWYEWRIEPTIINCIKAGSAYIALTVTLGRGGWNVQSNKGNTLTERIDRNIYKLAQYINVAILLVTLYYPGK
ncbi:hypothetical protein V4B68_09045 [Klebsiella pneumoniae]|jgi:hypothetical protein|uniref:hypothetical protein n=1 Tax=Klebsiella TaxID=570 RepID=UPI00058FB94E|nr:hypothetical protein [Klebsiella pneumoniae]HBQ5770616.1 hypothetical protein [Klebsiella pneumoniae subsp. pneumoniae]EKZ5571338.1 hypothetical protein [Klebsiella pneumoniae]MBA8000217.1 hypothetical protein [Klebsiella pneumoniae]MBM9409499.1 hypothetical protein [Klebsiella pneumoniae]MCQ0886805.1 hypothetical protein [Klebsiella pneumoniae]